MLSITISQTGNLWESHVRNYVRKSENGLRKNSREKLNFGKNAQKVRNCDEKSTQSTQNCHFLDLFLKKTNKYGQKSFFV